MKSQSENVRILLCSGGAWELVNGILEYIPLGLMKRAIALPSGMTQSLLVNLVSRKLGLADTRSGFKLSYRLPPQGDVVELVDDDDFSVFMDVVVQNLPEMVTLFVVECVSSSGNQADVGFNQSGSFFSGTVTPSSHQTYQHYETEQIDVQTPQKYMSRLVPKHEPTDVVDISDESVDGVESDKENDAEENPEVGRDCFWRMPPPLPTPKPFIIPKAPICSKPTSDIKHGQLYNTKEDLKLALRLKCLKEGFRIKTTRSSKDRLEAVCRYGKCEWRITASLVKRIDSFLVRKLVDRHTCLRT